MKFKKALLRLSLKEFEMKFLTMFFLIGSLAVGSLRAADAPKENKDAADSSQPMSETVKGQVKEQLDIQKPPPEINLDIQDIIESGTAQTDHVLQEAKPIPSAEDFDHYLTIGSNQVLNPANPLIPEPPLVTFYPGLSKVASKRWEFRVSDQNGEMIKAIQGKGVPPRKIEWNGVNEHGEYITVGTLYSYQFVTFDEHDNSHTFPGDSFQLDALMYPQKGKTYIEFSTERMFQSGTAVVRPAMQGLWARAIDVIRENSNHPLTIEVYADDEKSPLAEERRQAAVDMVSDATNIPAVDIRHKVEKATDRGNVLRLVLNAR
jgi:flagellar motor protein MotB